MKMTLIVRGHAERSTVYGPRSTVHAVTPESAVVCWSEPNFGSQGGRAADAQRRVSHGHRGWAVCGFCEDLGVEDGRLKLKSIDTRSLK